MVKRQNAHELSLRAKFVNQQTAVQLVVMDHTTGEEWMWEIPFGGRPQKIKAPVYMDDTSKHQDDAEGGILGDEGVVKSEEVESDEVSDDEDRD